MTIDGLGPVDPVSKFNRSSRTEKAAPKDKSDAINVSAEARSMNELFKASEEVKAAADIRQDRIDEVRKKLQDPNYINDTVIDAVADGIMKSFGLS